MHLQAARHRKAAWILRGLAILYIPLLALHFAFPSLFHWDTQIALLSRENAGLLWCLHACGIFWLASMGAATLIGSQKLSRPGKPDAGRSIWLWMAAFYLFRLLAEVPCFGFGSDTLFMLAILGALSGMYGAVWMLLTPARIAPVRNPRNDAIALLLH